MNSKIDRLTLYPLASILTCASFSTQKAAQKTMTAAVGLKIDWGTALISIVVEFQIGIGRFILSHVVEVLSSVQHDSHGKFA
jgi:hypothetical protein